MERLVQKTGLLNKRKVRVMQELQAILKFLGKMSSSIGIGHVT
jgi:hypothetical protein